MNALKLRLLLPAVMFFHGGLLAGPYSADSHDPANLHDAPVPGFVGPDGIGGARIDDGFGGFDNPRNYVNPLFFDWAATVANYQAAPAVDDVWRVLGKSLGPVTGNNFHVVSLGELNAMQIAANTPPGSITLHFANPIRNLTGADFTAFENALPASGGIFGELAYVEASSDGVNFVRFPSASLTPGAIGAYGTIDSTNVFNLAGKHVNYDGACWSTPFDLAAVGLASASYIRIVDIPGSGAFPDSANRPIYDPWVSFYGSGGFDLEAVGVISRAITFDQWQTVRGLAGAQRGAAVDVDKDGVPNFLEYAFARLPNLVDETASPTTTEIAAGRLVITFTRDERASDLLYEVQAAADPSASWTTIAQSTAGAPTVAAGVFTPSILETNASAIASVGVLRRVRVTDVQTVAGISRRFLRVKVTSLPVP